MTSDFTTILLRVVIVGGAIGIIGAGLLILAFRAFARPPDLRPSVLIAALLGFVLLCCALLMSLSFIR
jgi:hypothetical protein